MVLIIYVNIIKFILKVKSSSKQKSSTKRFNNSTNLVYREDQLKDRLLRIGSMDYEPLPAVKKYTLDAKVKECMDGPITEKPKEGSL